MGILKQSRNLNHAIFLDRDGVINQTYIRAGLPYPPQAVSEFKILSGVVEAVQKFKRASFKIIVATNQPDVSRGKQKQEVVEQMHQILLKAMPIDSIQVCYHSDQDKCECRKPKPGMLLQAAKEWHIDLEKSYMIGDRWRDIAAGLAAQCKTIWINNYIYNEPAPYQPNFTAKSLLEACQYIL